MTSGFIIATLVSSVVFIVIIFVLGLFTHLSPTLLLIMMFGFLIYVYVVVAVYSGEAAGKTGGKDADAANKSSHGYYTWATVIAWVCLGISIFIVIGLGLLAVFGGGEAAVGAEAAAGTEAALGAEAASVEAAVEKTASETAKSLAKEGISKAESEVASKAVSSTPEGSKIAQKIAKEEKEGGGFFQVLNKHQGSLGKLMKWVIYIALFITIILTFVIGLLLAIGASIQGGSDDKAGLKQAALGSALGLFVSGMYVIFFIVMYFRGRNLHKRLEEDLAKQKELTRTYLQQRQAGVAQAKGQYVGNLLVHNLGLNQPTYYPQPMY